MNGDRQFDVLVDALTDHAIYMLDPDGFVTSWNAGGQRVIGHRPDEIIGQHFSRFFTPEDQARGLPARILKEASVNGRSENEGWCVRKDGTRFWAAAVLQPMRDSSGQLRGFANITRDITNRLEAQRALQESESRFRLLVESVIDYAIYMLDPSGVITNWNAGAQHMKGYTAEEIVGQHFSRFYTKEDRAAGLPLRVLQVAAREGRYESEGWRVRKDGSRFWASAVLDAIRSDSGELLGFAKITRDITERQVVQEALRESERQFRRLIEGVSDYALFMLDPNGLITSWNTGAQRIKGYTADEIIGQHFSRFYTERERAAGVPARALYTAAHEGRFETESWRVRKDGSLFWANVIIDPIRDEDGELVGFAKITRDITERRETQLALEKAQAQRDQAQKMEALGQLTGGVAHDFNNLLTVIGGQVDVLKRLVVQNPRGLHAAEAIERAVTRGESLTRQLLTFSRRQALKPLAIGIADQIEVCRAILVSSLGSAVSLALDLPRDLWPVKVDVSEFELALVNVAINARDAMPQGGLLTIAAENVRLDPKDAPQGLEGDFVALTIADTGTGIAPDILPKVFDPFFTTKPTGKGSGLGLSQVHGFAHQAGGTVVIDSALGQGTRITLYLPRTETEPERAAAEPEVAGTAEGVALLVEDNPEVAEAGILMLEQLGYTVDAVGDAEAALEAVERRKVDLVVSDIVMAGAMDGIALARALRERYPNLPVMLVTGYTDAPALAQAEFSVLRKPYGLADLSRAIAKVTAEAGQPRPSNLVDLRDARRNLSKGERP
jgi:PAS domain S-box-containing protein